ncbi:MAG: acetyl-CoA C-acetyltransferase [Proteobacteria bacterium]|nr:MAG: acetyl-CoA C-acetyltransferase [Pseudomonadota bacterium]
MKTIRPVYVVGSSRIPFAKSLTSYKDVKRQDMLTATLANLVDKFGLGGKIVGDVALGALMNSSSDWNLARESVLGTNLHPETPAYNVQRACGTSLETVWHTGMKIATGSMDTAIAGGVDTNSDLPIEISDKLRRALIESSQGKTLLKKLEPFTKLWPADLKPKPSTVGEPRTGLSMGEHMELTAKEWKISRVSQDELSLRSHKAGSAAYDRGFFDDLVFPYGGLKRDGTLRGDTSLEKLAKLKPAFDKVNGTITAGNSSPLTDGAACVLLASDDGLKANNWKPLARLVDFQVAAVDFVHGAGLLMAPTIAVSKMLERNNFTFDDFDFFELHEAFASQVLCCLKAWESPEYSKNVLKREKPLGSIPVEKINVVGSSVAMGHPFAATGARITGTLAKLLSEKPKSRGLISICTAGGMGVVAILESV